MSIAEQITELKQDFDDVYEAGKEQESLEFWKAFTNNGNRTNYNYAFRYWGWKVANPSVKIKFKANYHTLFNDSPTLETIVPDNFDFSETPDVQVANTGAYYHTFSGCSKLKAIPDMDMPPRGMYFTFNGCTLLERIERVQIREDTDMQGAFGNLPSLKYIRFDGIIGLNIDLRSCVVLDRGSIENIIGCLSSNASNKTLYLSQAAVNQAFTAAEWSALEATKPNWNISLS